MCQLEALVIPHPYLFANGKFELKYESLADEYLTRTIIGLQEEHFILKMNYGTSSKALNRDCKLVARPISDMTGEEMINFMNPNVPITEKNLKEMKLDAKTIVKSDLNRDEVNIYLLSIGVYPFNQSHFEQDWLIDASAV